MDDEVFRDPAVKSFDSFRVMYDGWLTSPSFNSRGAALAYLDMLQRGARRPEYVDRRSSQSQKQADRIDGYDRDDLGESPDY